MSNGPNNPRREPIALGRSGDKPEDGWPITADCRHCKVRGQGLFSVLRGRDLDQLVPPVRAGVFPRQTLLYREGQRADAVLAVREGTVKLVKHASDGEERIVRVLGRGAAIGLEALTHGVYWHTAEALSSVDLCRIPLAVFDALKPRHAGLSERMIHQWQGQLRCADHWLVELSTGPVHERVRRLLVFLSEIDGSNGQRLQLPSTADLAKVLGTTRESVSRAVAELKRSGALARVGPHTYDCDLGALS